MKKAAGYFEAVFDILYLAAALILGWALLYSEASPAGRLYGAMALVLGIGDAFHLVPRVGAALSGGPGRFRRALGYGKMITSVTMTAFYVLLWQVGLLCFAPNGAGPWTVLVYALAAIRAVLCLLPQNDWTGDDPPLSWNVYRNVPFALLGLVVGVLFFIFRNEIAAFRLMWLAVLLSFLFYIPVALGSKRYPMLGMLMIPKTLAYVWIVVMGLFYGNVC